MTELAKAYAGGLYALCEEESLTQEVLSQLEALQAQFRAQPDFIRLLGNLSIAKGERVAIVDAALRGQVHPYVLNFLKLLCERGAAHEFAGCVAAYRAQYNDAHGVMQARVTTSAPLTGAQRAKLLQKLRGMTGREIALEEKLDPTVIDGVVLEMDGRRYDNTLRQRLQSIREALVGGA